MIKKISFSCNLGKMFVCSEVRYELLVLLSYCFEYFIVFFFPFPVYLHSRRSEVADEDEIKGCIPLAIRASFDSTGSLHISKIDHEVDTLHGNGPFKSGLTYTIFCLSLCKTTKHWNLEPRRTIKAASYNPDNPRTLKTMCLKCNSVRLLNPPSCFLLYVIHVC